MWPFSTKPKEPIFYDHPSGMVSRFPPIHLGIEAPPRRLSKEESGGVLPTMNLGLTPIPMTQTPEISAQITEKKIDNMENDLIISIHSLMDLELFNKLNAAILEVLGNHSLDTYKIRINEVTKTLEIYREE